METEWLRTFIVAAQTENFRETAENDLLHNQPLQSISSI